MAENTYRKKRSSGFGFFKILDRTFNLSAVLEKGVPTRYIPNLLFLALLGVLYIWNAHNAERVVRQSQRLEAEVENLRADYITLRTDYSNLSIQSVIQRNAEKIGLEQSDNKIQKIEIKKDEY